MNEHITELLDGAVVTGWVMEPIAKEILRSYGLPVTRFVWAKTWEQALAGAGELGWPVVAKIVSPEVVHKSDVGGVIVGIPDEAALREAWDFLSTLPAFDGVLLDEMISGAEVELIVGSKQDPQFGTVVLTGIGGTAVEIYKDVTIRMAPLSAEDAEDALSRLVGHELIEGHRGTTPVDREALIALLQGFSEAAHDLAARVESIDLNPVLCSAEQVIIADARLILK